MDNNTRMVVSQKLHDILSPLIPGDTATTPTVGSLLPVLPRGVRPINQTVKVTLWWWTTPIT